MQSMTGADPKLKKRPRGRPRLGVGLVRRIQISLPEDLAEKFMALGGSRWLRRKLAELPPVEIREKKVK